MKRVMPSRSRSLPAGFIAPRLPTNAPQPPSGPAMIAAPAVRREAEEDWGWR
jgi:hypothetical protein